MKKINLYLAALAMGMTACSQEEIVNNQVQEYTLDAEIVQATETNSRVNIGGLETPEGNGKPYHRVNWESGDTFCAFNATTEFSKAIPFTLKEVETASHKASFTTDTEFEKSDITYAVYPKKRFKGLKNGGTRIMLGLPTTQNMSESQDAVMIAKYDTEAKKMKFIQTMTMLEIVLDENVKNETYIEIEADRPIAAKNNEARIELTDSEKGFNGNVEFLPNKGTNKITLYNNDYASTKVYCAIPAGDYKWIKVSKGTYSQDGDKRTPTMEATPIKTVKAKAGAENGTFNLKKRLYVFDCTTAK